MIFAFTNGRERERQVKLDTPRITLERYNSLCPPEEKKDKMAVSRGHFSDMATGTRVVMTVIAENTGIYSRSMVLKPPY